MPEAGDLPWIDPQTASLEELEAARTKSWVAQSARGLEVLRFRQAVGVMEHPQLEKGPSFHRRLDDLGITDGPARELWNKMLVVNEGEYRHRLRLPLMKLFRGPEVAKLRGAVRAIIDQVLDEIEDLSQIDFMRDVAWKIPPRVYCHLVSAPLELAPMAARLSDSTLAPILTVDKSRRQETIDAFYETLDFIRVHIEERRDNLGDDFTSVMIRQQMDGLLTEEELLFEAASILQASIDNTVHQIGLTFGTLLEDRTRWTHVAENQNLMGVAVEETIRLRPRFGTIFRYAPNETKIEDRTAPANSWVFVSIRSANRDAEMFAEPDSFRFDRGVARALMFGGGPYNCLGQTLARLEIHETMKAMLERFPGLRMLGDWTRRDSNAITEVADFKATLV
jgi:cytochrome P450